METEKITETISTRFDHESKKQALKEKYEAKMLFAHAGGMWRAGPELLSLLNCCDNDECVLVDEYDTPVQVDRIILLTMTKQRWQEQLNAWLEEYNKLSKNR